MNKKNILILSSLSIISLIIASLGVSLAWFSASNDVYIAGNMDVSLAGDPTLKLGIKEDQDSDIIYYSSLSNKELNSDVIFDPISTMFSEKWLTNQEEIEAPIYKQSYRVGKINDESTYRETKDAENGYFYKDIYLLSDKDCYATVSSSSSFSSDIIRNEEISKTLKEEIYKDLSLEEINSNLNTTYKSLRYSFLYDNNQFLIYDPYKENDTIFAGTLDINKDDYYDYYSLNGSRYEFLYGEYENTEKIIYGTNPNNSNSELLTNTFISKTHNNVYHVDLEESIKNGLVVKKENSLSSNDLETGEMKKIFKLHRDEPYRVGLSIYLEGWDTDSTSLAMYGAFKSNLQFTITEETIYG